MLAMTVHAAILISETDNKISALMFIVVLCIWVLVLKFVSLFGRFSPLLLYITIHFGSTQGIIVL